MTEDGRIELSPRAVEGDLNAALVELEVVAGCSPQPPLGLGLLVGRPQKVDHVLGDQLRREGDAEEREPVQVHVK
jgi:hypothetical protein